MFLVRCACSQLLKPILKASVVTYHVTFLGHFSLTETGPLNVKIISDLKIISGAVTDHPRIDALVVTCCALFFGKSS